MTLELTMREGMSADTDDPTALILADRLASLGTLVAGVAHEINNPITYVIGNLSELEGLTGAMREALTAYRGLADPSQAAEIEAKLAQAGGLEVLDEILADALEGADRIRELIRDLLDLSRQSGQGHEALDVHELLATSLRLVARRAQPVAALRRDFGALGRVEGDRTQLGQVLLNLLNNAIDACQPADPQQHAIRVRTRDEAGRVAVEVSDTGGGIPDDLKPRVFSPFFTTKRVGEGTGLGLYISRRIAEAHGGTLDFQSDGAGTIFRLTLPARP
jgi:signal transduction histidine kinase